MSQYFYVYVHRKATTGGVFYVGKGTSVRAWKRDGRSRSWHNTVKKHGLVVEIVADGLQEWYAHELERDLIALHGRRDLGLGPLINLTDGGEGTSGAIVPDFKREALRTLAAERHKDPQFKAKHSAAVSAGKLGKPMSEKARSSISAALKGRKLSEKNIAGIAASWSNPDRRGYHRAAMKSVMSNPSVRKKISDSMKAREPSESQMLAIIASNREKAKKIVCIETGSIFSSISDASSWLRMNGAPKASRSALIAVCKGVSKTAYGYTWRYAQAA